MSVYWHGGQRGLKGFVLPPSETGASGLHSYAHRIKGGHVVRRDRVYVTTDKDAAIMYAATHPSGGAIYRVEPIGELVPDPDCDLPGLSFECAKARILTRRNVSGYEQRKVRAIFA